MGVAFSGGPQKSYLAVQERRPLERKAVTIIAGFRCKGGIVLCADTQETTSVGGVPLSKRNIPKLRFEEHSVYECALAGLPELAVAFCGAGDGSFIDKLVNESWAKARGSEGLDEACKAIEGAIKGVYQDFGQIYQPGQLPYASLIYGVKVAGEARLFSADGPLVNPVDDFRSSGCGYYMADFLASRMYNTSLTAPQCVVLAAYILFQAKEHVDGCGGDSHIAVLRETESSGRIDARSVEAVTKLLEHADRETGRMLLATANLGISEVEFKKEIQESVGWLEDFRHLNVSELAESTEFWRDLEKSMFGGEVSRDAFGLLEKEPNDASG
jgi:20S proteasome alpha/beta subunit